MKIYSITTVHGRLQFVQPASRGTMEPGSKYCCANMRGCQQICGSSCWFHLRKSRGTDGTLFISDKARTMMHVPCTSMIVMIVVRP